MPRLQRTGTTRYRGSKTVNQRYRLILNAEAASGEWVNFTTFSDDATVGLKAWINPERAELNDLAAAFVTPGFGDSPITSHYLKCLDLAKKIPDGVTVTGIQIRINKRVTGLAATDNILRLVREGTIEGDDNASVDNWPSAYVYKEYGGTADLWTLAWDATKINSATTGVVFSVDLTVDFVGALAEHVQMAVTYS